MSETIKTEDGISAVNSTSFLGKQKDESSSLLLNSVPAEIHGGAGPLPNMTQKIDKSEDAPRSEGSATLQHSFLTRVLHQPGSENAAESSIGSRDVKSSTSLHGRNIELVKLEDNEVPEDNGSQYSWMHQSKLGGAGPRDVTDDSYEDDFEMDTSLTLSATASKLAVPPHMA